MERKPRIDVCLVCDHGEIERWPSTESLKQKCRYCLTVLNIPGDPHEDIFLEPLSVKVGDDVVVPEWAQEYI
ncbi:MAG: hypothetical protein UW11_C0030G0006 [Parcubacteria group bacterium GW2011_GWA2_43_9b]|nr:MAG: hypothetical protein UW11_C0030G0006 [Parcubacteria group bacterium GW2011_GWA2_43_9b]